MSIDLHVHSTASDGTRTPVEVVEAAHRWGCTVLSLTDHDSIDGVPAAARRAEELGIEFIPGIEMNTNVGEQEVHILGYYIDPEHPELNEQLQARHESRLTRTKRIVAKLAELGVPIRYERVVEIADGAVITRPHIMDALVDAGHVCTAQEAWDRFLHTGGPAYVAHEEVRPEDAIRLIRRAGGVPVLAHPGPYGGEKCLPMCLEAGLMGLEVYYKEHTPEQVEKYRQLAERHGLLMTGGTDCHGPGTHRDYVIGDVDIPSAIMEPLRNKGLETRARRATTGGGVGMG